MVYGGDVIKVHPTLKHTGDNWYHNYETTKTKEKT